MKYVIVIPDGAADLPIEHLDGRTPFQAARTPSLDRLALSGRVGTAATTPPGFGAGSDVCTMDLLGCDPREFHTGRAPLEAAALGIEAAETDWLFRINLVTVGESEADEGLMLDHSAGAITDAEALELLEALREAWAESPRGAAPTLHHGVGYRGIVVDAQDHAATITTGPHEFPQQPWDRYLPKGGDGADRVRDLMLASLDVLRDHPVNAARRAAGKRPANMAWLWGQGTRPALPSFKERFALRGAMLTSVDLLRGIARLIGWDLIDCPGLTSYHDTDYAAQGRATIDALRDYDLVCCHVEAPDEASHQGDWRTKVASLEAIDRHVIAPIHEHLLTLGDPQDDPRAEGWRMLILPDHYTLCSTRKHDPTPVPFAMAGSWVRSVVQRHLTEPEADASDLHIDPGSDLMEYFLRSGIRGRSV
ncbi:MAG: 2,3-bisphosphoglycerate-independent phosphoglycerate mutase [Planctomycetota bacterium]